MNIRIVKNKYLNALLLLMLFSAIIHLLILFYTALTTQDLYVLNYFHILDITYFFPNFFKNRLGNIISILFVISFYVVLLKIDLLLNKINKRNVVILDRKSEK